MEGRLIYNETRQKFFRYIYSFSFLKKKKKKKR